MTPPLVWIQRSDFVRLLPLAQDKDTLLGREMMRAIICDACDMPSAVARVGDRIGYQIDDGPLQWGDLVLPPQADGEACVSVASPLGAALVGLRAGSSMVFVDSRGEARQLLVRNVVEHAVRHGGGGSP